MRYDSAANANRGGHVPHPPVSTVRLGDRDGAMSRQAAELDVWEDEGGTTAGPAPAFRRGRVRRHFDELSG
jgi:hypothetical protein